MKEYPQLDWCDINGAIVAKRAYSITHGYNKHGSSKPWKDCWAFLKKKILKVMENEKIFYPQKIFDIYLVKAPSPSTSKNVLLHELGNLVRRRTFGKSTAWQRSLEDHLVWSLTLCKQFLLNLHFQLPGRRGVGPTGWQIQAKLQVDHSVLKMIKTDLSVLKMIKTGQRISKTTIILDLSLVGLDPTQKVLPKVSL